jgi:hypothetical protein
MEKLHYDIAINATPEKVWKVLWTDKTYREWTSAFSEGSHAETDWKEGSKVLFLDGNGQGMVSKIAVNRPNEFMSFEHLGEVHEGKERRQRRYNQRKGKRMGRGARKLYTQKSKW